MACDPMTASLLPYAPERDVYRLLQVDPTASDQEIAVACRRLALAFHPDRNRSPRAHEEMQIVNAVRSLVSDPRARAAYDGARRRFLYYGERTVGTRAPGRGHADLGHAARCLASGGGPDHPVRASHALHGVAAPARGTDHAVRVPVALHRVAAPARPTGGPGRGGCGARRDGGVRAEPAARIAGSRSSGPTATACGAAPGSAARSSSAEPRRQGGGQARSGSVRSGSIPSSPIARASSSRLGRAGHAQAVERGVGDLLGAHLEVDAQRLARVAAAEAIGAQRGEGPVDPAAPPCAAPP